MYVKILCYTSTGLGTLAALAFLNVFSTSIIEEKPPIVNTFEVHELRRLHSFRGADRAILTFNLDMDLTPVWTWNTKQIFVFVMADYRGNKHVSHYFRYSFAEKCF